MDERDDYADPHQPAWRFLPGWVLEWPACALLLALLGGGLLFAIDPIDAILPW